MKGNKHVGTYTAEAQTVERNQHSFGCNTLRQVAGCNLYQTGRSSAKSLTRVAFYISNESVNGIEKNIFWPQMGLHACNCQNEMAEQPAGATSSV